LVTPVGATQEFVAVLIFKMQRPDADESVTLLVDASAVVQGPAIAAGIGLTSERHSAPKRDPAKTLEFAVKPYFFFIIS
jgi:hypothetical protein